MDRVGVGEQRVQVDAAGDVDRLTGLETRTDARHRDRAARPRVAGDHLRLVPDRGVGGPVLAPRHVPDNEADGVGAWDGLGYQLLGRKVACRMVETDVDRVQLLDQHLDCVHSGLLESLASA